jgi:hypothetical protein
VERPEAVFLLGGERLAGIGEEVGDGGRGVLSEELEQWHVERRGGELRRLRVLAVQRLLKNLHTQESLSLLICCSRISAKHEVVKQTEAIRPLRMQRHSMICKHPALRMFMPASITSNHNTPILRPWQHTAAAYPVTTVRKMISFHGEFQSCVGNGGLCLRC